jgi:hypothetical protein
MTSQRKPKASPARVPPPSSSPTRRRRGREGRAAGRDSRSLEPRPSGHLSGRGARRCTANAAPGAAPPCSPRRRIREARRGAAARRSPQRRSAAAHELHCRGPVTADVPAGGDGGRPCTRSLPLTRDDDVACVLILFARSSTRSTRSCGLLVHQAPAHHHLRRRLLHRPRRRPRHLRRLLHQVLPGPRAPPQHSMGAPTAESHDRAECTFGIDAGAAALWPRQQSWRRCLRVPRTAHVCIRRA